MTKTLTILIFLIFPYPVIGQELKLEMISIFKIINCQNTEKHKVYYYSINNITDYDIYQNPKLLSPYKERISNINRSDIDLKIIDLSISHNPNLRFYDKVPINEISKYIMIDTAYINQQITASHSINWKENITNCNNVIFREKLRFPRLFRVFGKKNISFVGTPIILRSDFAILKILDFNIGLKKTNGTEKLYFLEKSKQGWEVIEVFTVANKR